MARLFATFGGEIRQKQHLSSEIRQKQLKLKKLEHDIKLKEKTLQDSTKDRTRLETRILQLETQNEELLGTIRTLKRKISVLEETKDTHCSQTSIPRYSSGSHKTSDENDLMFNIHQKVTKYILKQIDHQLDKLDIASNNEKEPILNQNTSTNITANETVQSPIVEKTPTTVPYGHYNVVTQNNPSVFNPNRQILHNFCGPPVQYMAPPSKTNNTNSTYQMNKPVMRNPTRNSRTPWNKANIQRTTYNTADIRKKTIEKNQVPKSTNNDNKIQLDTKTNESVIIIDDESAQVGEPHFLEIKHRQNRPEITHSQTNENEHNSINIEHSELKICSYNCKNIKTSVLAINELFEKEYQILLIQEHWLFQFQIQLLGEVGENICYAGKGVDLNDPIQPVQLPRGHGGVAILWNKKLDKFITSLPDGGERIQCIQFKDQHYPVLIVSAYFPTGGVNSDDQYMDCLVQLEEILNKYLDSHEILIGGDLNLDLTKNCSNKKKKAPITLYRKLQLENHLRLSDIYQPTRDRLFRN